MTTAEQIKLELALNAHAKAIQDFQSDYLCEGSIAWIEINKLALTMIPMYLMAGLEVKDNTSNAA
jgi:hypothetical protein